MVWVHNYFKKGNEKLMFMSNVQENGDNSKSDGFALTLFYNT